MVAHRSQKAVGVRSRDRRLGSETGRKIVPYAYANRSGALRAGSAGPADLRWRLALAHVRF